MDMIKLGKKGQVSIPKGTLTKLGLCGDQMLLVDTTPEGGILLCPAGVYPLETYSDERVNEFLEEDRPTEYESARVQAKLNARRL